MESKSDDEMGFEKVDDEMGFKSDEDVVEYVKVEKIDTNVAYDDKSDADMENKENVVDDMEEEEKGPCPFPFLKSIQGIDLQEVDLSYTQYSSDTGSEDENMSIDDDVGYRGYTNALVVYKVDANAKYEEEDVDDQVINEYGMLVPYKFRMTQEMHLQEIVKDVVLPFLPAKSLVRFRSVSKKWDEWIKTPLLAHRQSYCCKDFSGYFCQYAIGDPKLVPLDNGVYGVPSESLSFLPAPVILISSSNGLLVCRGSDYDGPYYVCNPATQEWARLPPPTLYHGEEPSAVLALEPSRLNFGGHYHLLCAPPSFCQVPFELYSSETSSWTVPNISLVELGDYEIEGNGFYMNGVAYMKTSTRVVRAFHIAGELFQIFPLPREAPENGVLAQAQGELCYIALSHVSRNEYSVMIYAGMELSLRHRVDMKIGLEQVFLAQYRVLPCPDARRVMILVENVVYCYSLVDQCVEKVTSMGLSYGSLTSAKKYLPYVNSLVQVAKPLVG